MVKRCDVLLPITSAPEVNMDRLNAPGAHMNISALSSSSCRHSPKHSLISYTHAMKTHHFSLTKEIQQDTCSSICSLYRRSFAPALLMRDPPPER